MFELGDLDVVVHYLFPVESFVTCSSCNKLGVFYLALYIRTAPSIGRFRSAALLQSQILHRLVANEVPNIAGQSSP